MQSYKSSHKSDAKRSHPNRLGYKTQSKFAKSKSPYPTDSAEMGPGVHKTQSNHTKTKSCYRTGTISLRNASLCLHTGGKSGERRMEYR
jgi:hypothetical protein